MAKETKTEKKAEKKFRLLKNPEQTSLEQTYYVNGVAIIVPKGGYHFSLDKEMDETIEFLKKEYGFVEVK